MQGFKLTTELFFGSQAINHLEGLTYRNVLIITDGFLEYTTSDKFRTAPWS